MNSRYTPVAMFTLLLIALAAALFHRPSAPPPPRGTFPPLTLHALNTPGTVTSWQPAPGRVTLVNFFASWCAPCLAEHPQISTLQNHDSLDIVGIAWNDAPENLTRWLKQHGNPYARVWLDRDGQAAIALGIRGVPESFLIAPDGHIILHLQGALMPSQLPRLNALIERASHAPAN